MSNLSLVLINKTSSVKSVTMVTLRLRPQNLENSGIESATPKKKKKKKKIGEMGPK